MSYHKSFFALLCGVCMLFACGSLNAGTIEIGFLGLDLTYGDVDGELLLYDTPNSDGGDGDPLDADPLTAVSISVDSVLAGPVLTSDIFADIAIPVEIPVAASPGSSNAVSGPGIFDILTEAVVPAFGFGIDVDEVAITFVDALTAQFVFGAEVTSDIFEQNIPYGLRAIAPIEIAFNLSIIPGTLTEDGTNYTGFRATASGSIIAQEAPEPGSLMGLALLLGFGAVGRWSRS